MASGRAIRAARAFVEIFGDDSKLRKTLAGVKDKLKTFAKGVAVVGAAAGAAVVAGLAAGTAAVFKFAAAGDAIDKMSGRTGVAADALSQLGFAAEQSGSDIGAVETGIRNMSRQMLQAERGSAEITKTLTDLGISFTDLQGLSPDKQMEVFADAISRVEDPGKKAAFAMQVFGKSGTQLLPLLNGGAKGIRELRAEADSLGLTIGQEQAASAAAFTDAWNRIKRAMGGAVIQVGASLAPMMTDLATRILPLVVQAGQAVAVAAKVMGAGLLAAFDAINQGVGYLMDQFPDLVSSFSDTFGQIKNALQAGEYRLAARILWLALQEQWLIGTGALAEAWLGFKLTFLETFDAMLTSGIRKWVKFQGFLASKIVQLQAYFDDSINVDDVQATLTEDIERRIRTIDDGAAARSAEREADTGQAMAELQQMMSAARAELATARLQAKDAASSAAAVKKAADEGRFQDILGNLESASIEVKQATVSTGGSTSSGDLRSVSGAGQLLDMFNRDRQISERQLTILNRLANLQSELLRVTETGPRTANI